MVRSCGGASRFGEVLQKFRVRVHAPPTGVCVALHQGIPQEAEGGDQNGRRRVFPRIESPIFLQVGEIYTIINSNFTNYCFSAS